MGKVRRDFTREFKIEAVRLSHQTDKTVGEFAEDMGISRSSLSRWRSEFQDDPQQAFPGKGQQKERDAEVAQLKKQLKQAEMERDVLKKRWPSSPSPSGEVSIHLPASHHLAHQFDVPTAGCFSQWVLQLAAATGQRAEDGR